MHRRKYDPRSHIDVILIAFPERRAIADLNRRRDRSRWRRLLRRVRGWRWTAVDQGPRWK